MIITATTPVKSGDTLKSIRNRLFQSLMDKFDAVVPPKSMGQATHDLFALSAYVSKHCTAEWLTMHEVSISLEV